LCFLIVGQSKVKEKFFSIRRFLSHRVKPNHSNINKKKTIFLISRLRFTYKRVILNIKRKNKMIFWIFLKYWSSSRDFNKLVIKVKMHAKTYVFFFEIFFVWKYNVIFFLFRRLGRMHENKTFFLIFLTKTKYFNTRFVSLRYKITNQY
jgi:hypothetical protein